MGDMKISRRYGDTVEAEFYDRRPDTVARELLGKLIITRVNNHVTGGLITEVEAYFGVEDPASRAAKPGKIGEAMYRPPGKTLIYMVHGNWLLNIVTSSDEAGAVLIRSIEPLIGIETMYVRRGVTKKRLLTTGPGRLTKALGIDATLDNVEVYIENGVIEVKHYLDFSEAEIGRSGRIGVSKDLREPYRFYLINSRYVSK